MKCDLLWNEELENVIGLVSQFKTPEKFIEVVKKEYKSITNKDCNVKDVIVETCMSKVYYLATITELE